MSINIKNNGVWIKPTSLTVKNNNIQSDVKEGWIKNNNEWKLFFPDPLPATITPISAFDLTVAGGNVFSLNISGNMLYLGGNFQTVNGQTRRGAARVNADTGVVDSWSPDTGFATVFHVVPTNTGVFLGGGFSTVGGVSRRLLAKVNLTNGAVITSFNAYISGGSLCTNITYDSDDNNILISGNWDSVNGLDRPVIAKLNSMTGEAITGFNANLSSNMQNRSAKGMIISNGYLFSSIQYTSNPLILPDQIVRHNKNTGEILEVLLNNYAANSFINLSPTEIIFMGFYRLWSVTSTNLFGKMVLQNGTWQLDWTDALDAAGIDINGFESYIYPVGFFTTVNGIARQRIAKVYKPSGNVNSNWIINPNSSVRTSVLYNNNGQQYLFIGGDFSTISPAPDYTPITASRVAKLTL